jgi:hypothetical protein
MGLVTSKEVSKVIGLQKLGFLGTFIGLALHPNSSHLRDQ